MGTIWIFGIVMYSEPCVKTTQRILRMRKRMRITFLITGLLRTFHETLLPFLRKIAETDGIDVEFRIYTTSESHDTKFTNKSLHSQLTQTLSDSRTIVCVDNTDLSGLQTLTQRERNTVYQWYRLWKCSQTVELSPESLVIRIRPDIRIDISSDRFLQILRSVSNKALTIPSGNDICHPSFADSSIPTLNDQFAIGPWSLMKQYCGLYPQISWTSLPHPILSEALLATHLTILQIPVERIELPYTLCLSQCKMIAIAGDSGVGKSTLVTALRDVFPFDSNLVFETDRYHKWERGHTAWSSITHLNPSANYLEKLMDDTYCLKVGEQIQQVDYNHATGRFTDEVPIDSKPFIFLCGLHTMYKEDVRMNTDLKLYIDCAPDLKRFWKIQRDRVKRGYTFDECDAIFQKRQTDYRQFIAPQKGHADILVEYSTSESIPDRFESDYPCPPIQVTLRIRTEAETETVRRFLRKLCQEDVSASREWSVYSVPDLSVKEILEPIPVALQARLCADSIKASHLGILQCMVFLLCFT